MATAPRLLLVVLLAAPALLSTGCVSTSSDRTHPAAFALSAAGGADLGPLTDAYGRRRSLALAPSGVTSGPAWYTARNDLQRSVTAGYRTPTVQSARTVTIDRGPGGSGDGYSRHGRGYGFRDGYTTRTVRRAYRQVER